MNSEYTPKCTLTADRPRFGEHSGMASHCILAGTLSSFWYVLWLSRNVDSWVHLGRNFWMHSKMHAECSSTYILNALWHGLWLHSGRESGVCWHVFWLNCNMDSVCNMACIRYASCNGFYTFTHPYILSDESWVHPESSTMWIRSALRNWFSTDDAMNAECIQLWIRNANGMSSECIQVWTFFVNSEKHAENDLELWVYYDMASYMTWTQWISKLTMSSLGHRSCVYANNGSWKNLDVNPENNPSWVFNACCNGFWMHPAYISSWSTNELHVHIDTQFEVLS